MRDRVAFACMFLSDAQVSPDNTILYIWIAHTVAVFLFRKMRICLQLPRYIDKLTNEMKEAGNLEGILLTGLTKDGVDLMESYVDRTGDVQTASFCMLKVKKIQTYYITHTSTFWKSILVGHYPGQKP